MAACGTEEEAQPSQAGDIEVQDASWKDGTSTATDERLACTTADEPTNFTVYWLGPSFGGLPLTAILRRCDKPYPGEPIRANSVSFIYGTCEIPPDQTDGGCAPPLEVQTSPACELPPHSEKATVGTSIVAIHGSREVKQRARQQLAAVPQGTPPAAVASLTASTPSGELPPPAPGALRGNLSCETYGSSDAPGS